MQLGHITSAGQFTKKQVMEIFEIAQQMEGVFERKRRRYILADKNGIAILFNEPSTGTRNCIESAAHLLGVSIITASYSVETDLSVAKGESFGHTVRRICAQSPSLGALFIRCEETAWLEQAVAEAEKFGVKVVNCGNGPKEHPTQALTDLFTIWRRRNGNLEDRLTIVYAPTVKDSRVFHSHIELFPTCCPFLEVIVVARDDHQISKSEIERLRPRVANLDTNYGFLAEAVRQAHVLYVNRPQIERYGVDTPVDELLRQLRRELSPYLVTEQVLDAMPEGAFCMHALPINQHFQEIPPELEKHPKVICFTEQLRSKTVVMMALLTMLLE